MDWKKIDLIVASSKSYLVKKKFLDKVCKASLTGLVAVLIGCSASNKSVIISPRKRVKIFGGIEEKYNPVMIKAEYEYLQKEGYSLLFTPYFGFSSDKYTTFDGKVHNSSTILGLDFGVKWTRGKLYWKGSLGFDRLSRTFEKDETGANGHDFRNNFHIELGVGYLGDGWHVGPIFSHRSVGNSIFKWDEDKQNSGYNAFGLEYGERF